MTHEFQYESYVMKSCTMLCSVVVALEASDIQAATRVMFEPIV
jgi:hypothetical protein